MNGNEPASPSGLGIFGFTGLTKRELFAAMALQGLLACPNQSGDFGELVANAVQYADGLLAELKGKEKE